MTNERRGLTDTWEKYAHNGLPRDVAQANMQQILTHFVECGWGGCYTGIFKKIIKPYLDDVLVLKTFLSSPAIRETGDLERARGGEVIFYDLFKCLMNVESEAIRNYLQDTFPGFAERFKNAPFLL